MLVCCHDFIPLTCFDHFIVYIIWVVSYFKYLLSIEKWSINFLNNKDNFQRFLMSLAKWRPGELGLMLKRRQTMQTSLLAFGCALMTNEVKFIFHLSVLC